MPESDRGNSLEVLGDAESAGYLSEVLFVCGLLKCPIERIHRREQHADLNAEPRIRRLEFQVWDELNAEGRILCSLYLPHVCARERRPGMRHPARHTIGRVDTGSTIQGLETLLKSLPLSRTQTNPLVEVRLHSIEQGSVE